MRAILVLVSVISAFRVIAPLPEASSIFRNSSFAPSPEFFSGLRWRNIGPDRGGRSIAVTGHPDRPLEYYFGATGGGLWKTTDGGTTWRPVTDGQIGNLVDPLC